jgi:2-haloacid dehalogenase
MTGSATIDRRSLCAIFLAGGLLSDAPAGANAAPPIRALAFDAFTIFDPGSVTAAVVSAFGAHGREIARAWTSKIFELSWLETAAGRYSGLSALADAALAYSARTSGMELSPARRRELVAMFGELSAWPDAGDVLERLRKDGRRLAFLSNLSAEILVRNMKRAGLERVMEPPLSTDRVAAFKPSPSAYAMGPRYFNLAKAQIGFVAFGDWNAVGAGWFGYRVAWINRLKLPAGALAPAPDIVAGGLDGALRLCAGR